MHFGHGRDNEPPVLTLIEISGTEVTTIHDRTWAFVTLGGIVLVFLWIMWELWRWNGIRLPKRWKGTWGIAFGIVTVVIATVMLFHFKDRFDGSEEGKELLKKFRKSDKDGMRPAGFNELLTVWGDYMLVVLFFHMLWATYILQYLTTRPWSSSGESEEEAKMGIGSFFGAMGTGAPQAGVPYQFGGQQQQQQHLGGPMSAVSPVPGGAAPAALATGGAQRPFRMSGTPTAGLGQTRA